jgi:hypothetical protein
MMIGINRDQGTTGRQRLLKECPERCFVMAVSDRMLLPDQRIAATAYSS